MIEWAGAEAQADELEDLEGEFKITLDEAGTLRIFEFEFTIGDDEPTSIKATYLPLEDPIEPPKPQRVVGKLQRIETTAELRALYEEGFGTQNVLGR